MTLVVFVVGLMAIWGFLRQEAEGKRAMDGLERPQMAISPTTNTDYQI